MEQYACDYKDGSYFHMLSINASDLRDRYADVIYTGRIPKLIGMFLIGFPAERRDEFARITKNPKLYSIIALASLTSGILFNVAMAWLERSNVYSPPSRLGLLQTVCTVVGVPRNSPIITSRSPPARICVARWDGFWRPGIRMRRRWPGSAGAGAPFLRRAAAGN